MLNNLFHKDESKTLARIETRLIRIESRVCQVMLSMGLNPHEPLDVQRNTRNPVDIYSQKG